MPKVKKNKYGDLYVEATINKFIRATIGRNNFKEGDELSSKDALNLVFEQLDYYAQSNTGSEWLANVKDDEILFEKDA